MHKIEPYYRWRNLYRADKDSKSPFYGKEYSELECVNSIYNYYIHPQWDEIGSETLYVKILFTDYNTGYSIIELFGEWNDTLYNDIMFLKRNVVDKLNSNGINKFILVGENVFNFHSSDDLYYEEWFNDIGDGWIIGINFHEHVVKEFASVNIDHYIIFNASSYNWRVYSPNKLYMNIAGLITKRISN